MSPTITSRDVARLAGVAQSTVSYVMSGKGSISAETRERVLRAVAELGYRPNLAARSMRTRRSGRLAVLMGMRLVDPVPLLAGASAVAEAAGYTMEVHSIDGSAEARTERMLDLARSGQYEGLLAFGPVLATAEGDVPDEVRVVTTDDFDDDMRNVGPLADPSPVQTFVEHLAALGHTRFLHVAGPDTFTSARRRADAYRETVERLGLESLGVVGHSWSGDAAVAAVHALPDDTPPLAVIAANDLLAVAVLRAAAERGWSAPGDVSVTGWDNYDVGQYVTPSLTTVDGDRAEAGRRAMQHLVAALRGENPPSSDGPLNRIVWRESTAPPRDA